ncbi:AAA family ATPase, partial [Anaerobiospirillum succiniciproducens]|uniref:AAA family ATPase n=1 Tax=Anaerobiospirillum succiniciproducens TaxID=13335 RepID=UPI00248E755D
MSKEDLAVQVDELMATDKAQEETVHDPLTKLITEGLFIDKTLLIKEFLKDEESHKTYILRPHGFGKSTLLDIIEAMYTDMERLKGTKVYEEGFDESLPVIRIDMQKLIGAFPFPVKLDFNAKTAACVKNLKLLSSPNNKEKDDFGSALFAAFYEQIASGKQAIKPSYNTSSEHNNLERQADVERHGSDVERHGAADSTAHGSNLSASSAGEPSLASGNDKHSAGAHSAADRYEEDLIASLEALSTLSADAKSADAKTNGDKSAARAQDGARDRDDASYDADNSETDAYYQSIDELGRGEAKASYISTEHALKDGSFHSANQAHKSSKRGKDHGAVQDKLNGPFEQQDALSDGGVALLDSINENFSYIPSQTSEKSSLFYIAHLLSRCEHRSRVLLIDNFDAPLLATAYEPALYNRRSQVMHYLFTILGTYAHVFRHIIITSTMPYESYGPGMRERNPNDLELDMKFSYSAKCAKMIGVSEEDLLSPQLSKYMSKALSYMQAIHAKYKDKDLAAMHDDARSSFRHISLSMLELFVSGPCPQSTKELASLLSSFYGNFSFDRMTRTMAAVSVVNFLRHPEYGFAPYRYGSAPLDVRYAFDISGSSIADFMQVLSNIFKGEERVLLENATLPNALRPNSVIDRIVKLQRNLYRLKELKEQIIKAKGKGYKGEEIELINERLIYIRDRLNEIKKQMPTERSVSKALAAKVLPQKNASNSGGSVIYESAADTAAPDAASAQDAAAADKSSSQASKESESKSALRHKSPFAIIDDEDELEQATENQESSPSNTNSPSNTVQAYLDEVGESIEAIEQQAAAAMANANLDVQEANALDEDHGTAATNKTNEPSDSNAQAQDAAAVPSASDNTQTSGANSAKSQDGQAASSNNVMSNASVKDEDNAA